MLVAAPHSWLPPVAPLVVERRFRAVAPYAAGGRRTLRLAAGGDRLVRAPCAGSIAFRGRVAGGPPVVTIRCAELRATLSGVASGPGGVASGPGGVASKAVMESRRDGAVAGGASVSRGRGAAVAQGDVMGAALGASIGLSARTTDGTYLDPLPLLGRAATGHPPGAIPTIAPRRPLGPRPESAPRAVPRRAVALDGARSPAARIAGSALVQPVPLAPRASGNNPDALLGWLGVALAASSAVIARVRAQRRGLRGHRPRPATTEPAPPRPRGLPNAPRPD